MNHMPPRAGVSTGQPIKSSTVQPTTTARRRSIRRPAYRCPCSKGKPIAPTLPIRAARSDCRSAARPPRIGEINVTGKAGWDMRQPNDLLRRARSGRPSPSGSGQQMSRRELAEAVNSYLFAKTGRVFSIDDKHVGRLERGEFRWPSAVYREAFRAVLGASRDAELGFYITRRTADAKPLSPVRSEPAALTSPGQTPVGAITQRPAPGTPDVNLAPPVIQVTVRPGTAVTVVCHHDDPAQVAVVAGPVRLLIDASPDELNHVTLSPAWEETPPSEGARIYSIMDQTVR
jgi:hypothetical protein